MTRTRLLASSSVVLLATAVLALAPSAAHADGRYRPVYAGFGAGPYVFLDCCNVAARLSAEVGWHFDHEDRGFFLQVEVDTTFDPNDLFQFEGGLRLGGDIELVGNHRYGIMLRPSGFIGFGALDFTGPNNTYGFFFFQPAFDLRLAVADRLLAFWIRGLAFDFFVYFGGRSFQAAYAPMIGLDFQF